MTLASSLQSALESARSIAGSLGLHPYRAFLQTSSNPDSELFFGYGTPVTSETELLVGGQAPKVDQVSSKEAIASGGLYQTQDLRLGPFTPAYLSASDLSPNLAQGLAVRIRLTGPHLPALGNLYQVISVEPDSAFHTYLILRSV